MRAGVLRACLIGLTLASLLVALLFGSVAFDLATLWQVLRGEDNGLATTVILELRLPRALTALAVGGLLAVSGALLQVLLRNPLADPYVLGVSGGGSVAALLALLAGFSAAAVSASALAGSLAAMFLVFGLSHAQGVWNDTRLLLTGVVVASGCGALVSLILSLTPQNTLTNLIFWLLGDLSQPQVSPVWGLVVLVTGIAVALPFARALNLYARGEHVAAALGENVPLLRYGLYVLAALLAATALTLAGSIGFIGLVVPHLLRLLGDTDHRRLLPDAALAGGSLLMLADTLARTVVAPGQLPAGAVTALIGVPVFLWLLTRSARGAYGPT